MATYKKEHILECLQDEIPEGWEVCKIQNGYFAGVKIRCPYTPDEPHFNEDGYKYKQLFVSPGLTKHYKYLLSKGYDV